MLMPEVTMSVSRRFREAKTPASHYFDLSRLRHQIIHPV